MSDLKELGQQWCDLEIKYSEARKELQEYIERLMQLKESRRAVNSAIDTLLEHKFPEYRERYDPRRYDERYEKLPERVEVKYCITKAHKALALI